MRSALLLIHPIPQEGQDILKLVAVALVGGDQVLVCFEDQAGVLDFGMVAVA
jgi:hypothetical protein